MGTRPDRATRGVPFIRVTDKPTHETLWNRIAMPTYTAQQIADRVHGELRGAGDVVVNGVDQLNAALHGQITFVRDTRHATQWEKSNASAVLVSKGVTLETNPSRAVIVVEDADLALAVVLEMFAPPRAQPQPGTHPSATIDPTATISPQAVIGPGCVIAKRVSIASGCVCHANVTILDDTVLGPDCVLFPGVVIYERCMLGARVIVHANAILGADGFGYRPAPDRAGLVKIPQIGSVEIGDDVEIGSGTCIDRGKFSATLIGEGTKIDNLCQIAHNCRIGRHCILAAQVGLSGSVILGDGVVMGGQVGVADHITIGDGARIGGKTGVFFDDVPAGATWFGYPGCDHRAALRQGVALRRLPDLIKTMRKNQHPGQPETK